MVTRPLIPEPLKACLYGRRRHARHRLDLRGTIRGPRGEVNARVVDISRGGMLLRIPQHHLAPPAPTGGLVAANFGPRFRVDLPSVGLGLTTSLVRLAWPVEDPHHLYVGCRFPRALDDVALHTLGLPLEDGPPDQAPLADSALLPLGKKVGETLRIQVQDPGADYRVPVVDGVISGAGNRTIAVEDDAMTLDAVASNLPGRRLAVLVYRRDDPLWTVRAQLVGARPLPRRGSEVVLLAESSPARMLTSFLAPRVELGGLA